jgi:pimeloyl-ACP methyl ester carboxylesterase
MATSEKTISVLDDTLKLSLKDEGQGRPILLLHAGPGPQSMQGLAQSLGKSARSLLLTHPGFAGTERPAWCRRVPDLALAYLDLLERLKLQDVLLVGNSLGGWVAAEMALHASRRVQGIVLMNCPGIDATAEGLGIFNIGAVPPAERAAYSFHDPKRFALPPAEPEAAAQLGENIKTNILYGGEPNGVDPSLRDRLGAMPYPSLVLWGASDKVIPSAYGRLYASLMPASKFELIEEAGHFPQIEQLERVQKLILEFP